jgi:hypothetical protein
MHVYRRSVGAACFLILKVRTRTYLYLFYLYVDRTPACARQHPHRMKPSHSVSHPVGAAHRALCGAQQRDACAVLSERSDKFGISVLPLQVRRPHPGAPHCSFGTYLEGMQRELHARGR